jgi:hypothetical protein
LKDRVYPAKKEGPVQVQIEVAATGLGKMGAGVAGSITVPANRIVNALALGLDGLQPLR